MTCVNVGSENNETGVSWRKLKAEYVAGGISQRKLAEKYGIPFGTLQKQARLKKWNDARKKAEEKAVEKVTQKTAEAVADNAVLIERVKTGLLQRLVKMVEEYPEKNAAEIKKKENGAYLTYRIKDVAAILSVLEDKTEKGKSADIEDLFPLVELLKE